MRTIVSVAISADGYLDDNSSRRLVLSNESDWREVHALRAACDAILVGAETIRKDDPALIIRDEGLRESRKQVGLPPDIVKVAISGSCNLDPGARFFTEGGSGVRKIVITLEGADPEKVRALRQVATVIEMPVITAAQVCRILDGMGIRTLMAEGGAKILRMFLDEGVVDAMRIAQSRAITVGDPAAPKMPWYGDYPFAKDALSIDMRTLGNMDVTCYIFKDPFGDQTENSATPGHEDNIFRNIPMVSGFYPDTTMLKRAIDISQNCPPSQTAYSVGCVIKTLDGRVFEGYSRETSPINHAEEEAVIKAHIAGASLAGATLYSSLEPCSSRSSKPVSCSELIIRERIGRVVYACSEPDNFVHCEGTAMLRGAGIEVGVLPFLAARVLLVNAHILGRRNAVTEK